MLRRNNDFSRVEAETAKKSQVIGKVRGYGVTAARLFTTPPPTRVVQCRHPDGMSASSLIYSTGQAFASNTHSLISFGFLARFCSSLNSLRLRGKYLLRRGRALPILPALFERTLNLCVALKVLKRRSRSPSVSKFPRLHHQSAS